MVEDVSEGCLAPHGGGIVVMRGRGGEVVPQGVVVVDRCFAMSVGQVKGREAV